MKRIGRKNFEHIFKQSNAPLNPSPNTKWIDTNDGIEYTWVELNGVGQWIELSAGGQTDFSKLTPVVAIAIEGQTVFSVQYKPGMILVYKNGIFLNEGPDFSAEDGSTINIETPAHAGDIFSFIVINGFSLADVASQQELNNVRDSIGATGSNGDKIFYNSSQTILHSYEIPANTNALTSGILRIGQDLILSNIIGNGITLSLTTTAAHLCSPGDKFVISNTTNYNGTYTVNTVPNTMQLTALSSVNAAIETSGTFEKEVVISFADENGVWTHV